MQYASFIVTSACNSRRERPISTNLLRPAGLARSIDNFKKVEPPFDDLLARKLSFERITADCHITHAFGYDGAFLR